MGSSQNPTARKEGLVIQEMPEEVLVYDLNTNKAHCLNQTAAFVWKSCNGENSVTDIKLQMEKNFGTPVSEDFIWLAIDQLNKDNLLQEKINSKFEGVSRRDVIKKIGLASFVALPIVASLAVPNAALAAGSCAGASCNTTTSCASPCNCSGTGICSGNSVVCGGGLAPDPVFIGSPCNGLGAGTCQGNGTCG